MSLSCPRLRPIINNDKINPLDVGEKELCQVLCAYRIFMPFVGITVSSRESKSFRDGIVKIAATKVFLQASVTMKANTPARRPKVQRAMSSLKSMMNAALKPCMRICLRKDFSLC